MQSIVELDIHQAKKALDDGSAVFLDIRDPGSHADAHIAGALHLNDDTLPEFLKGADKSKLTVVYCYHGMSSRSATAFLSQQGFEAVRSMSGGFEAWRGTYEHARK